jgi:hypothetical protein
MRDDRGVAIRSSVMNRRLGTQQREWTRVVAGSTD